MSNPAPVVLYGAAGGSEAADHDRYVQQHHNGTTEPKGGREAPVPLRNTFMFFTWNAACLATLYQFQCGD